MHTPVSQWIYIMKKDVFRIHFYFISNADFRVRLLNVHTKSNNIFLRLHTVSVDHYII